MRNPEAGDEPLDAGTVALIAILLGALASILPSRVASSETMRLGHTLGSVAFMVTGGAIGFARRRASSGMALLSVGGGALLAAAMSIPGPSGVPFAVAWAALWVVIYAPAALLGAFVGSTVRARVTSPSAPFPAWEVVAFVPAVAGCAARLVFDAWAPALVGVLLSAVLAGRRGTHAAAFVALACLPGAVAFATIARDAGRDADSANLWFITMGGASVVGIAAACAGWAIGAAAARILRRRAVTGQRPSPEGLDS